MVSLAFAVAAPALAGTIGITGAVGVAAFGVAGGLLTAYIDQTLVFPGLFGKRNPRPDRIEGFQFSTTDPGAPRWEVYGARAWTVCHYLWALNLQDEVSGGGQQAKGGGGRPWIQTVRIDAGIATSDGPVQSIEAIYADERVAWARQLNRVALEDHRWIAFEYLGDLAVLSTDSDTVDFTAVFEANGYQFVRLEGFSPLALNGYYRVVAVNAHDGAIRSAIRLLPLQGQTPGDGVAGSPEQPAVIRRIDQGAASHEWGTYTGSGGPGTYKLNPGGATLPGLPTITHANIARVWSVNGVYRFLQWTAGPGVTVNGRYRLRGILFAAFGITPLDYMLLWTPLDGQSTSTVGTPGSAPLPGIIVRDEAGQFTFYDTEQSWTTHTGTLDQAADPNLSAIEANPPAHRGIAHISFGSWNLGPHNNVLPRLTALVRSRLGETAGAAIKRICSRSMDPDLADVTNLRAKQLLGYSIPGGLPSLPALQPILTFYGIAVQERGGVATFLDERDLPVVVVRTSHLNARGTGDGMTMPGFPAKRITPQRSPRRILIQYVDPAEGENEAEGVGGRSPGSADRGKGDTALIDLRPLVAWPYDVKKRARELYRRMKLELWRGETVLGPSYMDVLPGHVLTFVANNWEHEVLPAAATIAVDTRLRDILPDTVAVVVRFANGQIATLVDDGNGALEGFPAGITASVNTVDYTDGRVELLCSVALDDTFSPSLTYRYAKQWFMRASRATLRGHDFAVECSLVSTTTDDPLPAVPRDPPGLGGAITIVPSAYQVEMIDAPPIYPNPAAAVLLGIAVAPEPGAEWRGAVVYQSPNGSDRWSPIAQVQTPSVIGSMPTNTLPNTSSGATPDLIDWETEVEIELPGGEQLETITIDQLGWGQNWALIGDELIGFLDAEATGSNVWTIRGLLRGMRHTRLAMDTHADGDRFVLMTGIGGLHGAYPELGGAFAAANRTYYHRVVPGGAAVEDVATITTSVRGLSALPPRPLLEDSMVTQSVGNYVQVVWARRSNTATTIFGAPPLALGEFERYRVVAYDAIAAFSLFGTLGIEGAIDETTFRTWEVGNPSMGTTVVERQIRYTNAEMSADGITLDATLIGFVVYQLGLAGKSDRSEAVLFVPAS